MDTLDIQLHRFSVDTYHAMIAAEILTKEDKVELLDGVIEDMSPEGMDHREVVNLLTRFLVRAIDADSPIVQVGGPLTLRPDSEPEPDLSVVDHLPRAGRVDHPSSAYLVIEVSYSSLAKDRGRKLALYARAGIPEYWIFNLVAGHAVVHRDPVDDAYSCSEIVRPPGPLRCESLPLPPLDLTELVAR